MKTEKPTLSQTDLFFQKESVADAVRSVPLSAEAARSPAQDFGQQSYADIFAQDLLERHLISQRAIKSPPYQEYDPNGINAKSPGAKLDAGKPCIWRGLIDYFPGACRAVATVSTFGATKYSWKGWATVPEGFERYSDAMVRHLIAESAEGPWDNDSGLLHAAHAAWGALARLEFLLREKSLTATGEK